MKSHMCRLFGLCAPTQTFMLTQVLLTQSLVKDCQPLTLPSPSSFSDPPEDLSCPPPSSRYPLLLSPSPYLSSLSSHVSPPSQSPISSTMPSSCSPLLVTVPPPPPLLPPSPSSSPTGTHSSHPPVPEARDKKQRREKAIRYQ